MTTPAELEQVRERVRARYAQAADTVTAGGVPSCADTCAAADELGSGGCDRASRRLTLHNVHYRRSLTAAGWPVTILVPSHGSWRISLILANDQQIRREDR